MESVALEIERALKKLSTPKLCPGLFKKLPPQKKKKPLSA